MNQNDNIKLIKVLYPKDVGVKSGDNIIEALYVKRKTVKGVIVKDGKIALVTINNTLLPGGGIENGEDVIIALKRELKEELGIFVKVIEAIGKVYAYKNIDEAGEYKKYENICLICAYESEWRSVTTEGEIIWLAPQEALRNLSQQYANLIGDETKINILLNLKTHIYFIKEYISIENYKSKDFDKWNNLKKITSKKTDNDVEDFYYSEREVWWVEMGINVGHEQDGKGVNYLRPVVVLRKINKFTFIGVPVSSIIKDDKNRVSIKINLKNLGGQTTNDALLSQVRVFDVRRVKYQLGTIDNYEFLRFKKSMQDFLA